MKRGAPIVAWIVCLAVAAPLRAEPAGEAGDRAPAEVYGQLREHVFALTAEEIGLAETEALPDVFGVVMEWVQGEAVVSLVSLGEGTTSLYLSTGGGVIGGGAHETVREATLAFLRTAQGSLALFRKRPDHPTPPAGTTRFHLLTRKGPRVADAPDAALRQPGHPLFPLYAGGQRVLTRFRIATQAREGG